MHSKPLDWIVEDKIEQLLKVTIIDKLEIRLTQEFLLLSLLAFLMRGFRASISNSVQNLLSVSFVIVDHFC